MAGAYLSIPLNRDYSFTTNVASRLANVGNNLSGGTLYFLAKESPEADGDTDTVLNVTPTANTTTNVVTVAIPRAQTNTGELYPKLHWEIDLLTANNLFFTLDHGLGAIVLPVRNTA